MDLRRLRHFVTLADTLNFHRAAEQLHMAQPPLSVSIQKLEAEIGARLFVRESTGVSLTPIGQQVLADARKVLFHSEQFSERARQVQMGTGGTLHVGFVGSATHGPLQKLVPRFRADYPGVELVLREATSVQILQQLEDRALDVGLVRLPLLASGATRVFELERDSFVAALPRGHALSAHEALQLAQLAHEPFILYAPTGAAGLHSAVMLACQRAGFVPRVSQQAVQIQTVLALVESGLGVALVPSVMQRYASDRIVYRTLRDARHGDIALGLACRGDTESPAAARCRELALRWSAGHGSTP